MSANDYATATEIANMLSNLDTRGQTSAGINIQTLLSTIAKQVSRAFDLWTNRRPGAYFMDADETRYFDGPHKLRSSYDTLSRNYKRETFSYLGSHENLRFYPGELAAAPTSVGVSLTGSVTSYVAYAATDYFCGPYNALLDNKPYTYLELDLLNGSQASWYGFPKGIKVVGKFGYSSTVPDDVKLITINLAARWYKRGQNAFQDKISLLDPQTVLAYMKNEDADVMKAVQHYRIQAV